MPGISGIFTSRPSPACEQQVRLMVAMMRHRTDTESGTTFAPELGAYGGWIAHANSFAARQSTPDLPNAREQLLFSGECFATAPAIPRLVIDAYRTQGERFVGTLNGLFAGLLIDRERRTALLFNDRYSSERLYVFEKDGTVYFASEAKALLAILPELRAFDDAGVAQYLAFGSTIGGHTLFRGVRLVPGGSLWRHSPGAPIRKKRYFEPTQWEALPELEPDEWEARFADAFVRLLPAYVGGDRSVGLSLTGGIDTRMIVACLPPGMLPSVAYTYAAEGGDRLLDLTIARRIAAARAIPHQALRVDASFLANFPQQLDRTVYLSDGCAGVLGAHELSLSQKARQLAPVRLTGNFGSEVLRSMSTFKRNGPGNELLDPSLAAQVDRTVVEQQARIVHPVTHAAFEEVPWHLFGTLAVARSELTFRTPYLDNEVVELAYRAPPALRQAPRAAMRLIHRWAPGLAAIPTDRGLTSGPSTLRSRLHELACEVTFKLDYWHKEGLPDRLCRIDGVLDAFSHLGMLGLHKFLAYRIWFRQELAPYAADVIADTCGGGLPFWNAAALKHIAEDHVKGRRNCLRDIHAVLTLTAIDRILLDGRAYPASMATA
jgi:asparagine synthase (glutamine-hydrolysing)